ncbi:MAG: hypothetical protein V1722_04920 [Candidatus Micrarchaeota archaeon]
MDSGEFDNVTAEFREFSSRMKDPIVVGTLLHKLTEERQSTNLLLREINAKLDKLGEMEKKFSELEAKINKVNAQKVPAKSKMLPEVDEAIIAFIKSKSAVCAEDVQEEFKYKGKNAASARLNRLCSLGVLKKSQVGKRVFFEKN